MRAERGRREGASIVNDASRGFGCSKVSRYWNDQESCGIRLYLKEEKRVEWTIPRLLIHLRARATTRS